LEGSRGREIERSEQSKSRREANPALLWAKVWSVMFTTSQEHLARKVVVPWGRGVGGSRSRGETRGPAPNEAKRGRESKRRPEPGRRETKRRPRPRPGETKRSPGAKRTRRARYQTNPARRKSLDRKVLGCPAGTFGATRTVARAVVRNEAKRHNRQAAASCRARSRNEPNPPGAARPGRPANGWAMSRPVRNEAKRHIGEMAARLRAATDGSTTVWGAECWDASAHGWTTLGIPARRDYRDAARIASATACSIRSPRRSRARTVPSGPMSRICGMPRTP
jgi:hypothetical protein